MARLSDEERKQLKALQDKQKAPDGPGPSVTYAIDLSSDSAWERAKQLGLVREPEENGGDPEEEDEGDDTPTRRSYFGE